MTYNSGIPADYRGRDRMSLEEFVADVEACHFRTGHDTGANTNALFVWNILREWAGMESLDKEDLIRRHADTDGKSFEEMQEEYRLYEEFKRNNRVR